MGSRASPLEILPHQVLLLQRTCARAMEFIWQKPCHLHSQRPSLLKPVLAGTSTSYQTAALHTHRSNINSSRLAQTPHTIPSTSISIPNGRQYTKCQPRILNKRTCHANTCFRAERQYPPHSLCTSPESRIHPSKAHVRPPSLMKAKTWLPLTPLTRGPFPSLPYSVPSSYLLWKSQKTSHTYHRAEVNKRKKWKRYAQYNIAVTEARIRASFLLFYFSIFIILSTKQQNAWSHPAHVS